MKLGDKEKNEIVREVIKVVEENIRRDKYFIGEHSFDWQQYYKENTESSIGTNRIKINELMDSITELREEIAKIKAEGSMMDKVLLRIESIMSIVKDVSDGD